MKASGQPQNDAQGIGPELRQLRYGVSRDLSVKPQDEGLLVMSGLGQDGQRWSHVMTRHAAQVLWFKLTTQLYPEKAEVVTSIVSTAPLMALSVSATLTTFVEVVPAEGGYTLVGRFQRSRWLAEITEDEARRLWATLDQLLYPVGWEGRTTKGRKIN